MRVRATRGNSNTAFTASLDLVSVKIDYTTSAPGTAPTYDNNGNMTSDGSYGNRTYAYDTFRFLDPQIGSEASFEGFSAFTFMLIPPASEARPMIVIPQ